MIISDNKTSMDTITWNEDMSVHVKILDNQHKYFVGLMGRLYQDIVEQKSEHALGETLQKLMEYTSLHFQTEEKYFDLFQYEHSVEHKHQHALLLARVKEFVDKHTGGKAELGFSLLDFLEDWLVEHVETHDKKYSKCFNDHGLH